MDDLQRGEIDDMFLKRSETAEGIETRVANMYQLAAVAALLGPRPPTSPVSWAARPAPPALIYDAARETRATLREAGSP